MMITFIPLKITLTFFHFKNELNLFDSSNDRHRWLHSVCHHCLPTLTHYLFLFNFSASQEVGGLWEPHYSGFFVLWLPAGLISRDTSSRRREREDGRRGMFDNLFSCAFPWHSSSHGSNVGYLSWFNFFLLGRAYFYAWDSSGSGKLVHFSLRDDDSSLVFVIHWYLTPFFFSCQCSVNVERFMKPSSIKLFECPSFYARISLMEWCENSLLFSWFEAFKSLNFIYHIFIKLCKYLCSSSLFFFLSIIHHHSIPNASFRWFEICTLVFNLATFFPTPERNDQVLSEDPSCV